MISIEGRAAAVAMPPDFELVRVPEPRASAAEMMEALLGTNMEKAG